MKSFKVQVVNRSPHWPELLPKGFITEVTKGETTTKYMPNILTLGKIEYKHTPLYIKCTDQVVRDINMFLTAAGWSIDKLIKKI